MAIAKKYNLLDVLEIEQSIIDRHNDDLSKIVDKLNKKVHEIFYDSYEFEEKILETFQNEADKKNMAFILFIFPKFVKKIIENLRKKNIKAILNDFLLNTIKSTTIQNMNFYSEEAVKKYIEKVKKVVEESHDSFETSVDRKKTVEDNLKKITKNLIFNLSLISENQTRRFVGNLEKLIYLDSGISEYVWKNMQDLRVVGNPIGLYPVGNETHGDHWTRENKVFNFHFPPHDGAPGVAPGCRCRLQAIVPDSSSSRIFG